MLPLRLFFLWTCVYDSYKTLKRPPPSRRGGPDASTRALQFRKRNMKGCLSVWVIWACWCVFEPWSDSTFGLVVPFYIYLKALFVVFLIAFRPKSAEYILLRFLRPLVKPYISAIDLILDIFRTIGDLLIYYPIHKISSFFGSSNTEEEPTIAVVATVDYTAVMEDRSSDISNLNTQPRIAPPPQTSSKATSAPTIPIPPQTPRNPFTYATETPDTRKAFLPTPPSSRIMSNSEMVNSPSGVMGMNEYPRGPPIPHSITALPTPPSSHFLSTPVSPPRTDSHGSVTSQPRSVPPHVNLPEESSSSEGSDDSDEDETIQQRPQPQPHLQPLPRSASNTPGSVVSYNDDDPLSTNPRPRHPSQQHHASLASSTFSPPALSLPGLLFPKDPNSSFALSTPATSPPNYPSSTSTSTRSIDRPTAISPRPSRPPTTQSSRPSLSSSSSHITTPLSPPLPTITGPLARPKQSKVDLRHAAATQHKALPNIPPPSPIAQTNANTNIHTDYHHQRNLQPNSNIMTGGPVSSPPQPQARRTVSSGDDSESSDSSSDSSSLSDSDSRAQPTTSSRTEPVSVSVPDDESTSGSEEEEAEPAGRAQRGIEVDGEGSEGESESGSSSAASSVLSIPSTLRTTFSDKTVDSSWTLSSNPRGTSGRSAYTSPKDPGKGRKRQLEREALARVAMEREMERDRFQRAVGSPSNPNSNLSPPSSSRRKNEDVGRRTKTITHGGSVEEISSESGDDAEEMAEKKRKLKAQQSPPSSYQHSHSYSHSQSQSGPHSHSQPRSISDSHSYSRSNPTTQSGVYSQSRDESSHPRQDGASPYTSPWTYKPERLQSHRTPSESGRSVQSSHSNADSSTGAQSQSRGWYSARSTSATSSSSRTTQQSHLNPNHGTGSQYSDGGRTQKSRVASESAATTLIDAEKRWNVKGAPRLQGRVDDGRESKRGGSRR